MSPRHQETSLPIQQPVRFYKTVAISFLCLTLILLGVIGFMSSKRATITITTKEDPIDAQTTVTIGSTDPTASVSGVVTSTLVSVQMPFSPTGSTTSTGVSTGTVTLHNDSDAAQPLVATTRLQTPDGILFRLKDKVTVPANGTVSAAVYADKIGDSGNVGPITRFIIPGLNETRQKQVYGSSDQAMAGGIVTIGVLSADDIEKAKKEVISALEKKGQEQLKALYPDKPLVYSLVSQDITGIPTDIGKEVASFHLTGTATLVGVFYNADQVKAAGEDAMKKHVVDDIGILHTTATEPTVVLGEYHADKGTAEIIISYTGIVTLNPESKQLQKMVFFGKTKEEVRRDLLSLDHVYGVDVTFTPMWVTTVPYVPDHVDVVVKQVQ